MADDTVVYKRVKKVAAEGHHGGAWKVAYADFVTAMMAFFLLLWLLNATTEEQKRGISDYFSPQAVSESSSGSGGLLGGLAVSSPGALQSRTARPSVSLDLKPTSGADAGDAETEGGTPGKPAEDISREAAEKVLAEADRQAFEKVAEKIRQAMDRSPELQELRQNLLIDRTSEGLRIQIVDQEGQPMFPLGSAEMFERTRRLLAQIASVIGPLPNLLSISGHTDSKPFRGRSGYSNWELSSERALASRRVLTSSGLPARRIRQVIGRAATEPLDPGHPNSARNRRISIVLLRQKPASDTDGGGAAVPQKAEVPPESAPAPERDDFRRNWQGPRLR